MDKSSADILEKESFLWVSPEAARRLALGAITGPVLFTLAWFVFGFLSPGFTIFGTWVSPYSPISQPISGLGLNAPYMNAAFVLGGLLIMIGAVGIFWRLPELGNLGRWSGSLLLGLTALGLVVDGFFTLESIWLHLAGFLIGIGISVVSFLVLGRMLRRIPGWVASAAGCCGVVR